MIGSTHQVRMKKMTIKSPAANRREIIAKDQNQRIPIINHQNPDAVTVQDHHHLDGVQDHHHLDAVRGRHPLHGRDAAQGLLLQDTVQEVHQGSTVQGPLLLETVQDLEIGTIRALSPQEMAEVMW